MKPRLRAESVGVIGCFEGSEREGLEICDICWGRPMSINSVEYSLMHTNVNFLW